MVKLNLYRISQHTNNGYDTYDSAVVVAESKADAARIYPGGLEYRAGTYAYEEKLTPYIDEMDEFQYAGNWTREVEDVKVEKIGRANKSQESGTVIVASFRVG